jgi:hypothetical protein
MGYFLTNKLIGYKKNEFEILETIFQDKYTL